MWKNYGLISSKNKNAEDFTSDFGIKLRQVSFPLLKFIIKHNTGKKTYLVSYPKLEKDEGYIFAAGHSFPGEIGTNLSTLDRNAYTLIGTTDQVDHNPQMYFLWVSGMIYVNKLDQESRKESFKKMKRVLNNNTSVMMFPEGVLNNTENLNCERLYPGVYHLAKETGKKIVPIVSKYKYGYNTVLVAAGEPIEVEGKDKKELLTELRDNLATLRFNLSRMTIEQAKELDKLLTPEEFKKMNPELKIELKRESLTGDIHLQHMEKRKKIYQEVKWNYGEAFEEEIMHYKDKEIDDFDEVYSFVDNIDLENKNIETNIILGPVLRKRKEHQKYDIKEYMKKNFNK